MLFFNFFYMKVILKSDVPNLGDYGDIKIVANGYARNFLIPRKLATPLTSGRAKEIELIQAAAAKVQKARHEEMKAQIKKIAGLELEISAKSQKNKLFGSITAKNIADHLKEKGYKFEVKSIILDQPIKKVGEYQIPIQLNEELKETIKIIIKGEEEKEK